MKKSPFVLTLALVLALSLYSIIGVAAPSAEKASVHKYYTSITIQSGDSLWSIAQAQDPDRVVSTRDYVNEVMRINGMTDTNIRAGQKLTVFYFSPDKK
ncbi:MAG: LysM peptidoglycan-binding domain-containing protein [Lachnospiraceae bacterium]|nr:LysM peptidoglycan-binding domain-containing protein [Lachnospiraceae bacterium]